MTPLEEGVMTLPCDGVTDAKIAQWDNAQFQDVTHEDTQDTESTSALSMGAEPSVCNVVASNIAI